jgi:hypothetical protein
MSDIKARFVGHPDGVTLTVPVATEGEPPRHLTIPHGGELPNEIDGHPVPASFRDSLLEQKDNWTQVKRPEKKPDEKTPAKTGEKEA